MLLHYMYTHILTYQFKLKFILRKKNLLKLKKKIKKENYLSLTY